MCLVFLRILFVPSKFSNVLVKSCLNGLIVSVTFIEFAVTSPFSFFMLFICSFSFFLHGLARIITLIFLKNFSLVDY